MYSVREINYTANTTMKDRPEIKKLGVISEMSEMTPFVYKGKLYRVETNPAGDPGKMIFDGGFLIRNAETDECTPVIGSKYHFFSAFCENDTVYVFGTNEQGNRVWGGNTVRMFRSDDLRNWTEKDLFTRDRWLIYNTSVCKSPDGYLMAYEAGAPAAQVGVPFTIFFAKSADLENWELLPDEICYNRNRYTACPSIRFLPDGYYYMICLEALPLARYAPYIYRSRDLLTWEIGLHNPVLWISREDRMPKDGICFDDQTLSKIRSYMNINNCDVDLCEYNGKTVIYYLTGNQLGCGFMCEAVYDGPLDDFLQRHFQ